MRAALPRWVSITTLVVATTTGRMALADAALSGAHGACVDCHTMTRGSDHNRPQRLVRGCESCHATVAVAAMPGPARGHGACTDCHDPHATTPPHLRGEVMAASGVGGRYDDETRLCVGCHFDAGRFRGFGGGFVRHPVGIPAPQHGVRVVAADRAHWIGERDATEPAFELPLMPAAGPDAPAEGVIGCGTCHAVHGARSPFLLRWAHGEESAACTSCHGLDPSLAALAP